MLMVVSIPAASFGSSGERWPPSKPQGPKLSFPVACDTDCIPILGHLVLGAPNGASDK